MADKKELLDYENIFDQLSLSDSNKMNFYRGYMINQFAGIERLIDEFLSSYFIKEDELRIELNEIIIDRLNFEAKRTALKNILDRKEISNGFVKTKNNTYPHAHFLNEIRILNEERVKFAHYFMFDLSGLALQDSSHLKDKVFGLAEIRDSTKVIWYTKEIYVKIILRASEIQKELFDLIKTLKPT